MSNNEFYCVDNLVKMIAIFTEFMQQKYQTTPDKIGMNIKKDLFEIMQRIVQNPHHKEIPIQELNKIALSTLRDAVKKRTLGNPARKVENPQTSLSTQPPKQGDDNFLPRDHELFQNREVSGFGQSEMLERDSEPPKQAVDTAYERIVDERAPTKQSSPSELPTDKLDMSIGESDFKALLAKLENDRNVEMKEGFESMPMAIESDTREGNIREGNTREVDTRRNQLLMSSSEAVNERNNLITRTMDSIRDVDPKLIYAQNEMMQADTMNQYNNSPVVEISQRTPFIPRSVESKEILLEKYVAINSMDRDWINQKNRYQYKVKFSFTHKDMLKVPIYENNPTIPFTKTSLSPGIPNSNGYYDKNNIWRSAYDNGASLGSEIDYEYVETLTDDDTNIQQNFKNIHSIQVTKVILPLDLTLLNAKSGNLINFNFNFNYPYVIVKIDEFVDIYEGTDDVLRTAFCQMVYESTYQSTNGRGYIILKPVQDEKKVFYRTPLSSMPSINLNILSPSGQLLNASKDGYSVLKVEYEPFNKYYWKIVTNQYFSKNEFFKGDHVLIKLYTMHKLTVDMDLSLIDKINRYINRPEGHEITIIGDANDNGFYRTFYIRAPGAFSEDSGEYVIEQDLVDELVEFNCNYSLEDNPKNGYLLNMSLQNSVSLKIVTKDFDSPVMRSEMV